MEGDITEISTHAELPARSFGTADVVAKVTDAAFGRPLINNVLRGQVAEAIVALALEPEWNWCSADYAPWDFDRADGVRLEVKQSAYRQSWQTAPGVKIAPAFDVKARKQFWDGTAYVASNRRAADIYVLAYHGRADDSADHRDPHQWEFYVLPSHAIPPVSRIGLGSVRKLTIGVSFAELADKVREIAAGSQA
jgi:hypothetical protein